MHHFTKQSAVCALTWQAVEAASWQWVEELYFLVYLAFLSF